jgi:cell division protein FtsB
MRRDPASEPSCGAPLAPVREAVARTRVRARTQARKVWALRAGAAVLVAVTFGYLPYHLYAESGFADYLRLREDLRARQAQNARLRAEIERLAREAETLRAPDLRAIERVARADLGWVQPGEVVFEFGNPGRVPNPAPRERAP